MTFYSPILLKSICFIFIGGMLFSLTGCQNMPTSNNQTPLDAGQRIYSENCASCHGVSGVGSSMLLEGKNIHFNEASWQNKYTDEQLQTIIDSGRGSMPSFSGLFENNEEQALIKYIRTLSSVTN